jgi:hypothetical protein
MKTDNQLPEPPAIIKVTEDFIADLNLCNPLHAKAYLKAASHFLSDWPQEWDAHTLCLALLAEEEDDEENLANQKKIHPWDAIQKSSCFETQGGFGFLEEIINNLARDFIDFLNETDPS